MYKSILVPFDNSKSSIKALDYAVELASMVNIANKKNSEKIKIILVYVNPRIDPDVIFFDRPINLIDGRKIAFSDYIKESQQKLIKSIDEAFHILKDNYHSNVNIDIDSIILEGNPPEKIIEYAVDKKVDLIVIANIGMSGVTKVKSLGSVSRNVSEKSKCPVLIVHSYDDII